ncbi:protein of unknown function DUF58 [Xylanimonas cellulosilytica DSM 15894]|uniref:DUF58 domain-containing protein n=1 Tax=Xylanimonas cellulosilytica (strain DSM 15894 / JCM 12276 / CECT 5975 / KCTC 9989 / LMG 20990 / NBRC 107835 / XIL07) TaxID=446471 RepID=D1BWI9_XYLCX|nr:DUF58 domain-containing protein [Xylanimonas cellulosilytica]ACZ31534.1 protein of unknown function DUF58 [Xylanimonas cellulosilytica DSM 15894]
MTITGRALALAALGIVPVLLWPDRGTVILLAAVVVLACAVDTALAASPRKVALTRRVPASVRLGEPARSELTVANVAGRRLRGVVRDAWPPSVAVLPDGGGSDGGGSDGAASVGAASSGSVVGASLATTVDTARHRVELRDGDAVRVVTPLLPTRRGDRHAGKVTVRTLGPLGLAGRQASLDVPARLRVLPEFASRRHLPSRLARLREMDGRSAVKVRGEGTEFDSLREYVVGDDVRSIDWRATARRGDVVVRTWRPERDRRVLIVLDTGRTSATRIATSSGGRPGTDAPRLDASIEATLLLAALADRAGDRVQVLAFDRALGARVAGASGARLLPELAEALAGVEPRLLETDWPGLVGQVRAHVPQRALVVLLTALDPAAVETGLLTVVDQLVGTHQVVVAGVADAEVAALRAGRGPAEVYDAAAAARGDLERAAVAGVLRRHGAEVIEELPDALPPALADTYLALKAAGRL